MGVWGNVNDEIQKLSLSLGISLISTLYGLIAGYLLFEPMKKNVQRQLDNLKQFIEIIKTNYPSQAEDIDSYYSFENSTDRYLNEFIENCKTIGNDISTKNEIIFSKGTIVLQNIDFNTIWNDEQLTDEQRENIWKYLQTLYVFAYEYIKES